MQELESSLRVECAKLDRLIVQGQSLDAEINKADDANERLVHADDEVLQDDSYCAKLAAAETLLHEAKTKRRACEIVIGRQQAKVAEIEGRIELNRLNALRIDIEPDAKEFFAHLEPALRAAVKLEAKFARARMSDRLGETGLVFKAHNPADLGERSMDRMYAAQVMGLLIAMNRSRALLDYGYVEEAA